MRKRIGSLNSRRRQAGDTLVSIILSLATISLVMVIAYVLISNSLRLSQQAREREQVNNVLQGQIESLKYLVFNAGDHLFGNPDLDSPEGFCLVDHRPADSSLTHLRISALQLDASRRPLASQPAGNALRPSSGHPGCVVFSSLDAADVRIWIVYDRGGDGDPETPDEEYLFTAMAEWDGIGGGEQRMTVALRLPPPRASRGGP